MLRGLSWIIPLPLRPLAPVRYDDSLRRSFWPECEKARERERETELTATQANHLIGCHSALTFEGYRSISPKMRKRDEREATGGGVEGDRICSRRVADSAAAYQRICLSVRTSRPHLPYDLHPPRVLRLLAPSLALSSSLSRPENRAGKDRDERKEEEIQSGASRGAPGSERVRPGRGTAARG